MYVCCTLDMGLFLNHNRTPKSFQKFYYAQIDVPISVKISNYWQRSAFWTYSAKVEEEKNFRYIYIQWVVNFGISHRCVELK